jgi:large subunit ribosomal protein L19
MAIQVKIKGKEVNVGDLIRVFVRLVEGEKTRVQVFEGLVIGIKGRGEDKTFTVRRIAVGNIGVERIWPVNSPWIEKIEIKKRGRVRRAKLYYLRQRKGRAALKVKSRRLGKAKWEEKVIKKKKTGVAAKKSDQKTSGKAGRKTSPKTSSK